MAAKKSLAASSKVPRLLEGRFGVLDVTPSTEGGRRPAKAVVGQPIPIRATIFREGHDALGAHACLYRPDATLVERVRMVPVNDGLDHWDAVVRPDVEGDGWFVIEAWSDALASWRRRAELKVAADVEAEVELLIGAELLERAARGVPRNAGRARIHAAALDLRALKGAPATRLAGALADDVWTILSGYPLMDLLTRTGPWPLRVDRRRALFGSWYEFFPRSEGASLTPPRSGTFATAAERLPAIAEAGFDVVYLPPIHPIGESFRKGPNNTKTAGPNDPGSPWAIGSSAGGHDAIHPELGTLNDFRAFVKRANNLGMEIALDLALQASPDHPWVSAHPEWFIQRPDGSIAYAENPPKRYQDIYPIYFDGDPGGLSDEIERIIRFWVRQGIRIFRVDNPHTKPLDFWERMLARIAATDPDVLFLAEAFTRPPMMRALAEVGFHQSYTYFTWRNRPAELVEYLEELCGPASSYIRPNFFVNTPDILTEYLQRGGPAAFTIRATLAATLSPTWGVYAGFELFEDAPVRVGSEEYLDSEKYQYRPRDWTGEEAAGRTLTPYLTLLNRIRRDNPALQQLQDIHFHRVDGDSVLAYSKRDADNIVLVVITTEPHAVVEATVHWDLAALGLAEGFTVHDLVTNSKWYWGSDTYVRLDPLDACAHIAVVTKQQP